MHPYVGLDANRLRFWAVCFLAAWALLTPILFFAATERVAATIADLATAGSPAAAADVLANWTARDRAAQTFILGFDLLYDVVHNNAVALCAVWAAAPLSRRWGVGGSLLAWWLWLATAANVVENLAFFHMLQTAPRSPWPELGLATTVFRNAAMFGGILFALAAGGSRLARR